VSIALARAPETPLRTWGKLREIYRKVGESRNTPTHVGKTQQGERADTRMGNTPTHVGKTAEKLIAFDLG